MRIVVTGIGSISSIGSSAEETLDSLIKMRPGIAPVKYLNTVHNTLPCGEIPLDEPALRRLINVDDDETITRTSLIGIIAAKEALAKAGLEGGINRTWPARMGFISGTTVGGMEKSEQYYGDFISNDNHKDYIGAHDCGACTEKIADYFGAFEYLSTISTACSSAANSIALGAELINEGRLDIAVAGGSECLTKFHLNGFNSLMILDSRPCRPFDSSRAGLNLGEGAAYLVLENRDNALKRGAKILCELTGWGNACDAHHQTASSPEGKGAAISMAKAINMAQLRPEDIGYINAHGTGTGNNDLSEANAMVTVFNGQVPPFSSTKPYTGHTTSAAGGIEAVISILALNNRFLPPNLNFSEPMPEVGLVPVLSVHKTDSLNHVLSNSFGFGGNNTSLVFSTCK